MRGPRATSCSQKPPRKGKLAVVVAVGENPDLPIGQAFGVTENQPLLPKKKGRVLAFDAFTGGEE